MKVKVIIGLIVFLVVTSLPFWVQAVSGHIFDGLSIPNFGDAAAVQEGASGEGDAAPGEYGGSLTIPGLPGASPENRLSLEDMRNHMNLLKEEGRSTDQCLICHPNKEEFCGRCHSYVGIDPTFD